jgi:hypothetical protein
MLGDMDMDEIRKHAIDRLLKRREAIQKAYDELIAEPESYGVTGAVNVSNRKLEDLRKELASIDEKISSLINGSGIAGMTIKYPDYRISPFGGLQ